MSQQDLLDQIEEAANITLANVQEAKDVLAEAKAISLKINNEQVISINNSKEAIRQAIVNKGQSCSRSVPFDQYAEKIMAIEGGEGGASSNFIKGFDSDGKFLYRLGLKIGPGFNKNDEDDYYETDLNRNLSLLTTTYNFTSDLKYDYSKLKNRKFLSYSISNTGNYALMVGTDKNLYALNYGNNPGSLQKFSGLEFLEPTLVDNAGNWKKVYVDYTESYLFNENDELYVCGVNNEYKFGLGNTKNIWSKRKIEVDGISTWEKVACYGCCSFYLSKNGRLFSTGRNYFGSLGIDLHDDGVEYNLNEITVEGVTSWKDVTLYDTSVAAISSDGKLYVWGNNDYCQLEEDLPDPYDMSSYDFEWYEYDPSNLINAELSFNSDKSTLTLSNLSDPSELNGTYEKVESASSNEIDRYVKSTPIDFGYFNCYISLRESSGYYIFEIWRKKDVHYKKYWHEFNINSSDPYDLSAIDSENFSSESLEISEDKNTITLTPDFSNDEVSCGYRFYDYPLTKMANNNVFAYYESSSFGCCDYIHFIEIIKVSDTQFTWKIGMYSGEGEQEDMSDFYGRLWSGNRHSYKPKRIGLNKSWKKACMGYYYLLALTTDGELYSCGFNSYGRNGQGESNDDVTPYLTKIGSKSNWKDIFIGGHEREFLAIDNENKAYFNGYHAKQFGGRNGEDEASNTPIWTGLKFDDSVEFSTDLYYFLANENIDYSEYQSQLYKTDKSNQYKLIIPSDVTHISNYLFESSSRSSYRYIFIPNEVINIDANAFANKSSSDTFKLFFECTKEDAMALEGYPWGLNEDKHFIFNAEFEKIPDGGEINYYIQNEFPDGYERTI